MLGRLKQVQRLPESELVVELVALAFELSHAQAGRQIFRHLRPASRQRLGVLLFPLAAFEIAHAPFEILCGPTLILGELGLGLGKLAKAVTLFLLGRGDLLIAHGQNAARRARLLDELLLLNERDARLAHRVGPPGTILADRLELGPLSAQAVQFWFRHGSLHLLQKKSGNRQRCGRWSRGSAYAAICTYIAGCVPASSSAASHRKYAMYAIWP